MIFIRLFFAVIFGFISISCNSDPLQSSNPMLRDLKPNEALADFEQLASSIQAFYAPLHYKQSRFRFDFRDVTNNYRQKIADANGDREVFGLMKAYLRTLRDPHVDLRMSIASFGAARLTLPLRVESIDSHVVVSGVGEAAAAAGIAVGDTLIEIDGESVHRQLETLIRYETFGNDESDRHLAQFLVDRPFYMLEITPSSEQALLELERPQGERYFASLVWRAKDIRTPLLENSQFRTADQAFAERADLVVASGPPNLHEDKSPFYVNDQINRVKSLTPLVVSDTNLKRFNARREDVLSVYAVTYRHKDKTILLLRQPTYKSNHWRDLINSYKAILSEASSQVDALIVDQTRNPGGSVAYAESFARLFLKHQSPGIVFRLRADRRWITELEAWALDLDPTLDSEASLDLAITAQQVEQAYDSGSLLAPPRPLGTLRILNPYPDFAWTKPTLVVIDELAVSSAELFAAIIKCSGSAKLFGQRTMGGGGNVEVVTQLSNSSWSVALTRSLFAPHGELPTQCADLPEIENNGISPDFAYRYTREDLASGYIRYFDAISDAAVE